MRTAEEILTRYMAVRAASTGLFDFSVFLLAYLPFDEAVRSGTLLEGVTAQDWADPNPCDAVSVLAEMRSYMNFAWEKALGERGLSAIRSIEHYRTWCWLLGDDDLVLRLESGSGYTPYGVPLLAAICEKYGFPIPDDSRIAWLRAGEAVGHGGVEEDR